MRLVSLSVVAAMLFVGVLSSSDYVAQFEHFKKSFNRKYVSHSEEAKRLGYFVRNMQKAAELSKRNPLATFGVNEFSDMSDAEFKRRHNGEAFYRRAAKKGSKTLVEPKATSVQQIDWRTKGAVTAVKNQGDCGSCWSFSTTGNIEGQWEIAGNTLVSLSEQELVSCDTTCSGCNGGLMDDAFEWLVNTQSGGITSEAQYPYTSGSGVAPGCSMSGITPVAYINGHYDVAHSESAMASYIASNGPLSIGVDASSWQTYTGGILTDCTSNQVDHGVLAVGFDLTYSTPYWIIKNSWAASWGEQGYIRVGYGSNQCLITTAPSSSTVGNGPHPPSPPSPPSPPNPPSPPSPPATGSFTQYTCTSSFCLSGCQSNSFQTGVCLQLQGGGSAVATCGSFNLYLQEYTSSDCSGAATSDSMPLDQCLQDTTGTYLYNTCTGGGSASGSSSSGGAGQVEKSNHAAKVLKSKK